VTNEAVDGGGSGDDAETDLDVQTISGLAPGANIIVYDMGSLTDQAIEDAYNKVLSDGKASVVNSSFGGCESSGHAVRRLDERDRRARRRRRRHLCRIGR